MNTIYNKHKLGWTSLLFAKVDKKEKKRKKNQHGHFVLIKTRENGHERFSMMLRTLTSIYKLEPVHCGSQRNNRLRSLHPSRGGEWKGPSTGGIVNDRTWIEPSKKTKKQTNHGESPAIEPGDVEAQRRPNRRQKNLTGDSGGHHHRAGGGVLLDWWMGFVVFSSSEKPFCAKEACRDLREVLCTMCVCGRAFV